MEQKIAAISIIAIILALGLVAVSLNTNESRTLIADGTEETQISPDEAVLFISVETIKDSVQDSQNQNSEILEKVISSLKAAGINEIETNSYRVFPEYDYSSERERTLTGYTTSHSLKITTTNISQVGAFIDAASEAGANRVDNIQFQLSDLRIAKARTDLLAKASSKAKLKAEAMASSVDVKLGKIKSISESSPNSYPVAFAESAVADGSRTPIQPRNVELSVTVTIVYTI